MFKRSHDLQRNYMYVCIYYIYLYILHIASEKVLNMFCFYLMYVMYFCEIYLLKVNIYQNLMSSMDDTLMLVFALTHKVYKFSSKKNKIQAVPVIYSLLYNVPHSLRQSTSTLMTIVMSSNTSFSMKHSYRIPVFFGQ